MEKQYEKPEMDVVDVSGLDVVCASGDDKADNTGNGDVWS